MTIAFLIAGLVSVTYHVIAIIAAIAHKWRRAVPSTTCPPVSILKPVYGLDDEFLAAIRSHAVQDYPAFEIVFGVHSLQDPAVGAVEQLIAEYPRVPIRIVEAGNGAANGKVHILTRLAAEAKYSVLLVNDSDISVPPEYLRRITAPLVDPAVGLVTCLYRAESTSFAGKWEALGIATDFIPSTLVAPLVGIREFGLGSTLCFRRLDLDRIGGFSSIADYIADDYQLSKRITSLGLHTHLSDVVVSTHLSDPDWSSVWAHQVRWARTIRVSRGDGYAGLPVTHAGLWALLSAATGMVWLALLLIAARILSGLFGGVGVLRQKRLLYLFPLIPLWDLWAFAVWIAGWAGSVVVWRGKRYRLTHDGLLVPV